MFDALSISDNFHDSYEFPFEKQCNRIWAINAVHAWGVSNTLFAHAVIQYLYICRVEQSHFVCLLIRPFYFFSISFHLPSTDMLRNGTIFKRRTKIANIQKTTDRFGLSLGSIRCTGSHTRRAQLPRTQFGFAVDQFDVVGMFGRIVGQFAELCCRCEKGENRRRRREFR